MTERPEHARPQGDVSPTYPVNWTAPTGGCCVPAIYANQVRLRAAPGGGFLAAVTVQIEPGS